MDPRLNVRVMILCGSSLLLRGNTFPMKLRAVVNRNPAPIPWTILNAIIISMPSHRQRPIELPKNTDVPMSTAFLGPSLSMIVPAIMTVATSAMMYPESSHPVRSDPVSAFRRY